MNNSTITWKWLQLYGVLLVVGVLTIGCTSLDAERESDLPWNVPQSWEGSPSIPGLSN